MHSLKQLKAKHSSLYKQTIDWAKTLNVRENDENGERFHKYIERNMKTPSPFDSFILANKTTVFGVVSVVPDDRAAGETLHLEGMWIGGFNIREDYSGLGLGNKLAELLDEKLTELTIKKKKNIQVNLFANNPFSIKIFTKIGFKKLKGVFFQEDGNKEQVFSKLYTKK